MSFMRHTMLSDYRKPALQRSWRCTSKGKGGGRAPTSGVGLAAAATAGARVLIEPTLMNRKYQEIPPDGRQTEVYDEIPFSILSNHNTPSSSYATPLVPSPAASADTVCSTDSIATQQYEEESDVFDTVCALCDRTSDDVDATGPFWWTNQTVACNDCYKAMDYLSQCGFSAL